MNERGEAKRHLERANGNIDGAIEHMAGVIESYRALHPEISEGLEMIVAGLMAAQQAITDVNATI